MSSASIQGTIESAISKSTIFEVLDSSGGGGPDGFIFETSNVMTLATGATGGLFRFGTTYGGNFSVQIENDALNASTANISTGNRCDFESMIANGKSHRIYSGVSTLASNVQFRGTYLGAGAAAASSLDFFAIYTI